MTSPLEISILKTLCYADIFDYPLTPEEIFRYLIISPGESVTFNSVAAEISHLFSQRKIMHQSGYYTLPGRGKIVSLRRSRQIAGVVKLDRARKIAAKLSHVPTILGVFVTGALAMNNTATADDIDVMIVTRANRLWTTRLLVTIFLDLLRTRRHVHSHLVHNLICPNLYLDETALALPREKRNLYTAHEIIQVKPLINKDQIYKRFISANRWALRYLPHATSSPSTPEVKEVCTPGVSRFEGFAFHLQRLYMSRHRTRETVTPHAAFFHPRDTGQLTLQKYQTKLDTIRS